MPPDIPGEAEGMTAGSGKEGLGETDLRMDCAEPNEDRLLCVVGGGFIGRARLCGVPGAEGAGEPVPLSTADSDTICARPRKSGGAGLLEEIRRCGTSILLTLLCWANVN